MKAIHNGDDISSKVLAVVVNHKTTKFESNSQLTDPVVAKTALLLSITKLQNLKAIHNETEQDKQPFSVVVNHKTTKFESNSQLPATP